jgi:hypothetical protein
VLRVFKVLLDLKVLKVHKESRVLKEFKVHKVSKVQQEIVEVSLIPLVQLLLTQILVMELLDIIVLP